VALTLLVLVTRKYHVANTSGTRKPDRRSVNLSLLLITLLPQLSCSLRAGLRVL
jgi:hypothetical protein